MREIYGGTISEMIALLEEAKNEYGDLVIFGRYRLREGTCMSDSFELKTTSLIIEKSRDLWD